MPLIRRVCLISELISAEICLKKYNKKEFLCFSLLKNNCNKLVTTDMKQHVPQRPVKQYLYIIWRAIVAIKIQIMFLNYYSKNI